VEAAAEFDRSQDRRALVISAHPGWGWAKDRGFWLRRHWDDIRRQPRVRAGLNAAKRHASFADRRRKTDNGVAGDATS
jgi:hypothetical protein